MSNKTEDYIKYIRKLGMSKVLIGDKQFCTAIGSSFIDFAFCRTGGYGYWFFIRRFRGLLNRWMQLAFFVRRLQGYIELIDKLHISPAFLRYIEKIPNLRMFKNNQGTKRRRCGRESVQKCKRGIIR